jgi:hypothetical protein
MKSEEFTFALNKLFNDIDLGQGRYSWYQREIGDHRPLRRWLSGKHLPSLDNWEILEKKLLIKTGGDPGLSRRVSDLAGLLKQERAKSEQSQRVRWHHRSRRGKRRKLSQETQDVEDVEVEPTSELPSYISHAPTIVESPVSKKLWNEKTATFFHRALGDAEWAWAAQPFIPGIPTSDVQLFYRKAGSRYELPKIELAPFKRWCASSPKASRLLGDPWGLQVRIQRAQFNHRRHTYDIHLAPTKFLFYSAVQSELWRPEHRKLRHLAFDNALNGLDRGDDLILPSTFAVHMCVVSSDGMAFLRRRSQRTNLYPLAWEAGVGEFMHGPFRTKYRHFTRGGKPSLPSYLRGAVAEELNYRGARSEHFRIFGFAAEHRTLAPKLMVVYFSDAPITKLMKNAKEARDRALELASIPLTVDGVATALVSPQFRSWGPTSKLALLLALIERSGNDSVVGQLMACRKSLLSREKNKPPRA